MIIFLSVHPLLGNKCRWCPILPLTVGIGNQYVGLSCQQYLVCCCVVLVLVHYSFGISCTSFLIADGSFPFPDCCNPFGLCIEPDSSPVWDGLERQSTHGSLVFWRVERKPTERICFQDSRRCYILSTIDYIRSLYFGLVPSTSCSPYWTLQTSLFAYEFCNIHMEWE